MKTILALLLCAIALRAQPLILTVNDARSHGAIGDAKLSLDEAISLVNLDNIARAGYLTTMAFSAAERGQIAQNPAGDDLVKIAAALVPLITYERELTPIVTSVHQHQNLAIEGDGRPTLDAKAFSAAFPVRTNHVRITGLRLVGGTTAIDADTSLHYHSGTNGVFTDLVIEGQSQAGIRFPIKPNQPGQALPFRVRGCVVRNAPIGIEVAANTLFPYLDLEVERCRLENDTIGIKVGAQITLGVVSVKLLRTDIVGSDTAILVRRPAVTTSDGRVDLTILYGEILASHHAIDAQGSTQGETNVQVQQASLRGGPSGGDYVLSTWPKTARFNLDATETTFEGNVSILASQDTAQILLHNDRFQNGSFTIDSDGVAGIPDLLWDVFESCPLTVAATSATPFKIVQSEFVRSPVQCASSAGGNLTLDMCYRGSSPLSGNVSELNPAGTRWLGRASVTPPAPKAGAYVDLQLDYQPGMLGAWVVGMSLPRPNTSNYPFRFYFDTASFVGIPGPFVLRDLLRLPIPQDNALVGLELFAQPVAIPQALRAWQSPLTLPAGGRFVIQ